MNFICVVGGKAVPLRPKQGNHAVKVPHDARESGENPGLYLQL